MKINNLLISIIVPAYNIKEYLPRCLDSILNQTYKNLEIIVVSDGSTDGTNEIITEYSTKDSRIVPIFKNNSGVSDTRNIGLDMAHGDYIGFVDGDDYIEQEMYETLLKNAIENDADISHCGYQMVFPSRTDYYYNTGKFIIQNNKKGIIDIITGKYIEPGTCNKLYKSKCIKDVRMPTHIRNNEDFLFNYYAFKNSYKSVFIDIPFYHYILRKNSATTSSINEHKLYDPLKVIETIFEDCCINYDNEIQALAYKRYTNTLIRLFRTLQKFKINDKKSYSYKEKYKNVKIDFPINKRTKIERILLLYFQPLHMFVYKIYDNFLSKNKDKYEVK